MSISFPRDSVAAGAADAPVLFAEEITELSLLVPGWQAAALERAARSRGLTTGEMLRDLIRDFLTQSERRNCLARN